MCLQLNSTQERPHKLTRLIEKKQTYLAHKSMLQHVIYSRQLIGLCVIDCYVTTCLITPQTLVQRFLCNITLYSRTKIE